MNKKIKGIMLISPYLFFIVDFAYNQFGQIQNTNWSIFYYSGIYVSMIIPLIFTISKKSFVENIPQLTLGIFYIMSIYNNLKGLGLDYRIFYATINSGMWTVLYSIVILAILSYYIIKKWHK